MNSKSLCKSLCYGLLLIVPFVVDRLTKFFALNLIQDTVPVMPGVSLVLVKNQGLSWGMLYAQNAWHAKLLILLIGIVIGGLALYTYNCWRRSQVIVGQLLVLSGAISNLLDRFIYSGVIDFIELSAYGWVWPDFNVADIAIVLGVGIMLYQNWRNL